MYSTALQEKYHCTLTVTSMLSSAWPEGPSRIGYLLLSSHWGFIRLNACTLLSYLHGSMTQQEQLLATSPGPYCSFLDAGAPGYASALACMLCTPCTPAFLDWLPSRKRWACFLHWIHSSPRSDGVIAHCALDGQKFAQTRFLLAGFLRPLCPGLWVPGAQRRL